MIVYVLRNKYSVDLQLVYTPNLFYLHTIQMVRFFIQNFQAHNSSYNVYIQLFF